MPGEYERKMAEVLSREDIHPIAALAAAADIFWDDMERAQDRDDLPFAWTPEAICLEMDERIGARIPPRTYSKLFAALRIFLGSLEPFRSVHEFREMINLLADEDSTPNPDGTLMFSEVTPSELVRGVWIMKQLARPLVDGEEDPDQFFSEPVRRFMGFILDEYGYVGSQDPPPLEGLPIRRKAANPYGPIDDLGPEVARIQASKEEELESDLAHDIEALNDQFRELPLRHARGEAPGPARPA